MFFQFSTELNLPVTLDLPQILLNGPEVGDDGNNEIEKGKSDSIMRDLPADYIYFSLLSYHVFPFLSYTDLYLCVSSRLTTHPC